SCSLQKGGMTFVDENTFSFMNSPPDGVNFGSYCNPCFDEHVGPELDKYQQKMELAKNVNVFYSTQSKESRFVRRVEPPIKVENCEDREEVIMRLAFLAVQLDKNSIVDVDLKSTKVRNGAWQSSLWSGRAIPANIDDRSLQRKFPGTPN